MCGQVSYMGTWMEVVSEVLLRWSRLFIRALLQLLSVFVIW